MNRIRESLVERIVGSVMATRKTAAKKAVKKRANDKRSYTPYTEAAADDICGHIVEGKSIRAICAMEGMPCKATIFNWLAKHDDFQKNYIIAASERAHSRFEGVDDVIAELRAGKIDSRTARVMIYAIQWQCAIEKPDRYGQVNRHELTGKNGKPIQTQNLPPAEMSPEQRREEIHKLMTEHPELAAIISPKE